MNTTRAITMIRAAGFKTVVVQWVNSKVNNALAALFTWALSKREVQSAIVDAFTLRCTPMCSALEDAARSAVEHEMRTFEVDAENITGLDRYMESAVENACKDFDLSDMKHFDDAVERVVNGMETKDIVENVMEEVIDRLRQR